MRPTIYLLLFSLRCLVTSEKILTHNETESLQNVYNNNEIASRNAGYGLVRFEDETYPLEQNDGRVTFEGESSGFQISDQTNNAGVVFEQHNNYYEEQNNQPDYGFPSYTQLNMNNQIQQGYGLLNNNQQFEQHMNAVYHDNGITFQEDNRIEPEANPNKGANKKRRRRRRKPKMQRFPGQGYGFGNPNVIGFQGPQNGGYGYINPAFNGQYHRPLRRPRPTLSSDAFSAVTGALTSIARYDDYQCVPRLLCEAAGGGVLGSSNLLQSAAGLQPLFTLLSAYNGISTSPLFVFGRAVFLGMTSKGNTASCRYAYSQCPTDPEQLVHYLNNHNGGFFRFFNAPYLQNPQQNLEQFYNQLAGQNYGLYQNQGIPQEGLGIYPGTNQGFHSPNLYGNQQNYGLGYPYAQNGVRFKNKEETENINGNNKIQKRIQNKPDIDNTEDDNYETNNLQNTDPGFVYVNLNVPDSNANSKWAFPGDTTSKPLDVKDDRKLKFPEQEKQFKIKKTPKAFLFPGTQTNRHYVDYYNYPPIVQIQSYDKFRKDHIYHNSIGNKYSNGDTDKSEEEGVRVVYVVRGNGDPNNPEIVKLQPGQELH